MFNQACRNGTIEQAQRGHRPEASSHGVVPNGNDKASFLQNTSSLQSMLRNTTEMGHVGQFSTKQHLMPSLMSEVTPKLAVRPRNGSRNFSQPVPHHSQVPYHGGARRTPRVPRHGPYSPRSGRGLKPPSPSSYRRPIRGPSVDEYRTYSMTQSSYVTHSLTNRYPYVNGGHNQTRGQVYNMRPRSPFAYPTRLKRPGYRPSSPSLSLSRSDLERQSSRTVSPASMYNMNRIPTPWQQVASRSDPVICCYPPASGALSSRGSTPKLAPSLRSVASSTHQSQAQTAYPGAWPDSPPSSTPPPLFYDYTEAFEEQTHVHRISVSVVTSPSPDLADGQDGYFGHHEGPELEYPVELPSENPHAHVTNVIASKSGDLLPQSKADHQSECSELYSQQPGKSIEAPDLSLFTLELPKHPPPSFIKAEYRETAKDDLQKPHTAAKHLATVQHNIPDQDDIRCGPSPVQDHREELGEQHKHEHDSSSPAASMYSVQSNVPLDNLDDSTAPTSGTDTAVASLDGPPRTPIAKPHQFENARQLTNDHSSETMKASASVKSMRNDFPEIVAPTPERSITSLSNRDRFSKILGLDEGFLELDGLKALSNRRASKSGCAASPVTKIHRRPQESLSPPTTADHAIAEETDSDNEHELTNGLIETFHKPVENDLKSKPVERIPDSLPESRHDSPIPSAMRGPLKVEIPGSTCFRLSHRKTVINGGQRLETRSSNDCHPYTTEETSGASHGSYLDGKEPVHVEKDLPVAPRSSPSIKAFAPPKMASMSDLPFAFMPLIRPLIDDVPLIELEATTSSYLGKHDSQSERGESLPPQSRHRLDRVSTASPPGSRPWNLDASYPWDNDEPPKLDVAMPLPDIDEQQPTERFPKFKLRIHRASSSSASKLTKKQRSSEETTSSLIASSVDLLKSASFRRTPKPPNLSLSSAPGQSNSSHDVIRISPMQTRFVESFDTTSPTSPVIRLLPPSPGLDVRSFFSDDSSQGRPKGSLRKRFSDFRARKSRANSVEHVPGYDRGLLNSAFGLSRASGRSSRQSQDTAGATSHVSQTRPLRWNIFGRIRSWFSSREDKVRDWKWKRRYKPQANCDTNTPLYAGV